MGECFVGGVRKESKIISEIVTIPENVKSISVELGKRPQLVIARSKNNREVNFGASSFEVSTGNYGVVVELTNAGISLTKSWGHPEPLSISIEYAAFM